MPKYKEKEWYDIMVRQPGNVGKISQKLLEPMEVYESKYSSPVVGGIDIQTVVKGFRSDSNEAMISSGLTAWEASEYLASHLMEESEMLRKKKKAPRLLELGSGLGICGLLIHHLLQSPKAGCSSIASTVLTDGDTNVLQVLRRNIQENTDSDDDIVSCEQLLWGREGARDFLSRQEYDWAKFDIIIGADLLYSNNSNIERLFETVDELIHTHGMFIYAHNEEHQISAHRVVWAAARQNLYCEVMRQQDQMHILRFRRALPNSVNGVIERLQTYIKTVESANSELTMIKEHLEFKCRRLDDRCAELSGAVHHPQSILVSMEGDNLADVASYLTPQDCANLALTCKHFGRRTHTVGCKLVSLTEKTAIQIVRASTPEEREALKRYESSQSPFLLLEKLIEMRQPLKFGRLFGSPSRIRHATGDESRIVSPKLLGEGPIKVHPGTSIAYSAVSNHIMSSGKHYVTFTCQHDADPVSKRPVN